MQRKYETKEPVSFCENGHLIYISYHVLDDNNWSPNPHIHHFTELFFITEGSGSINIRNTFFPLQAYDYFIINPSVEHYEKGSSSDFLKYIVIGFYGVDFFQSQSEKSYLKGSFKSIHPVITLILNQLLSEFEKKEDGYQKICSDYLNLLASYLYRFQKVTVPITEKTPVAAIPKDTNSYWIKQYIEENYTLDINLDKLSEIIGINKYTMIRNFKQIYGFTPINYINTLRIEGAKFLLRTTETPCKAISESLGFKSSNYFTQFFRTQVGSSPSDYRMRFSVRSDSDPDKP